MAGGLLNIVISGSQDLYLTGTPEITHFKVIYRRYTNFSVESIRINFEDSVGFGQKTHLVFPRIGDLISKTYLEINIPQVSIKRNIDSSDIQQAKEEYINSLERLNDMNIYMDLNIKAYKAAYDIFIDNNEIKVSDMADAIRSVFSTVSVSKSLILASTRTPNDIMNSIISDTDIFKMSEFDLLMLADLIPLNSDKNTFMKMIVSHIDKSFTVQKYYETITEELRLKYIDTMNRNYKFAWVKRLGHALIDYVTVYIGGQEIDKHYGDWINIWWELTKNSYQEDNYYKMIGDVSELTTFDRNTKPSYTIHVPLNFWFSKNFYGNAVPLIAMEYNDMSIEVKFKQADLCAYIENIGDGDISISDLFENNDIVLNSSLLVDYVYLDAPERRKFAQSAHEYLVDQVKYLSLENINVTNVPIILDFNHPCKEIIWVIQKQSYMLNQDGHTETQLFNYSTSTGKNPLLNAKLELNGYQRIELSEGNYFNLLRPYYSHKNIPSNGINLYSFSLCPEENQPSGSCNFSRITKSLLTLNIDPSTFKNDDISGNYVEDLVNIRVYAVIHNVLRFISGMGALANS
jgi:hypothetical protein